MAPAKQTAVLLLDLPDKALTGIDLLSFTATPRFQGVKSLPPGWHFVFTSTNSNLSIRHGVWFRVSANSHEALELHVKRWDKAGEELVQVTEEAELLRFRANIGSLWNERLTPYRQSLPQAESNRAKADEDDALPDDDENARDWVELTSSISVDVLRRVLGGTENHYVLTTASTAKRDLDMIPGLTELESHSYQDKDLNFLPVDLKQTWREGATGRERTTAARDRSWALQNLVRTSCPKHGLRDVLGEFQFCFIMVLTLNNYSCLEQWKRILELCLTSIDAIHEEPRFFTDFLSILLLQLQHCEDAEGGLFDLSDQGATLLKSLLHKFSRGCKEVDAPNTVIRAHSKLEEYLRKEHNWQFGSSYVKTGMIELEDGERVEMDYANDDEDDETGEYAPVVVEMPEKDEQHLKRELPTRSRFDVKEHSAMGVHEDEDEQDLQDMDARY